MKRLLLILSAGTTVLSQTLRADEPAVPTGNFPATRYESLWAKSPFAVATAEESQQSSPDYALAGIANVDGVSYASVIDNHNQEHFLVSSDKPSRGLTLTSITRSHNGSDTVAVVVKDGQSITLKLAPPAAATPLPGAQQPNAAAVPGNMAPQILMPGGPASFPNPASMRPFTRIHRPPIHVPPPPTVQPVNTQAQGTPAPAPAPPPPAQ